MARVGKQLTKNAKRRFRHHAVTQQRMRGNAREPKLNHRTSGEGGNALES
jgi:hypothetical protein